MHSHEGPVLSVCWSGVSIIMHPYAAVFVSDFSKFRKQDGTKVFSGGCDNKVKCWPLATGNASVCAQVSVCRQVFRTLHT